MLASVFKFLCSLRLTVVLLVLGIAVVFFGTLAQTSDGLYIAQARYFRSWFSTWTPHSGPSWVIVPLPGGYLLGTLLLANLLAAHIKRFQFTWNKVGIHLTHLGIITLLLGQLLTDMMARESRMSFAEGQARSYSEDFHTFELAFTTDAPDKPGFEDAVVIPESKLKTVSEIRQAQLPFTVKIREYLPNSDPSFRAPMMTNDPPQASEGIAQRFRFQSTPVTTKMDSKNIPSVVLELVDNGGKSLGTWVASGWIGDESMTQVAALGLAKSMMGGGGERPEEMRRVREMARQFMGILAVPQTVRVDGREFALTLRPTRYYEPYAIRLLKTTHEVYQGTKTPKDFRSRVKLEHPGGIGDREVEIFMNSPLRYSGLAFFQFQMGEDQFAAVPRGTSVLQVVKNPSWLTPYVGCIVVGIGMTWQFLYHLSKFLKKRTPSTNLP